MTKSLLRHAGRDKFEIGWRELIGLPELGIAELRAKIDTGARTSALHAVDLELGMRDQHRWIEFHVPLPGTPRSKRCACRVVDDRLIKNTGGVAEQRFVIETMLTLGQRHWHIEISLADRENMEFDLILGRTALRGRRILINPGRSFLAGPPIEAVKPHNGLQRTLRRGQSRRVKSLKRNMT